MEENEYPNLLSDCSQAYYFMKIDRFKAIDRIKEITRLGFSECEAKSIVEGYLEDERIRQRKNTLQRSQQP